MEVVVVNTTKTNKPSGWWRADNKRAAKCDYLLEENHREIINIYTFSEVSEKNKDNRFSFKNLVKVTDSIIVDRLKKDVKISRKRGESNPVRYFTV